MPILSHTLKTLVSLSVQLVFVGRNKRYVIVVDVMQALWCCEDCSGMSVMHQK